MVKKVLKVVRGPHPRRTERAGNRGSVTDAGQILERSRSIVAAAYALLDKAGLEGLTIRAVLDKTGLSRRAFYERFAGKDDLMLAVFEHTVRLAADHYRARVATLTDPLARMELIVTCIVLGQSTLREGGGNPSGGNTSRRGAAMSLEHLRLAQTRPDDLQAALDPLIALIAEQLSRGMELGSVRVCAPQRLATLVYNLVATTVHTELLAQEARVRDRPRRLQLAADLWEFCRGAIAAP